MDPYLSKLSFRDYSAADDDGLDKRPPKRISFESSFLMKNRAGWFTYLVKFALVTCQFFFFHIIVATSVYGKSIEKLVFESVENFYCISYLPKMGHRKNLQQLCRSPILKLSG